MRAPTPRRKGGRVGRQNGCGGNSGRTALAVVPLAGVLRRDGTPPLIKNPDLGSSINLGLSKTPPPLLWGHPSPLAGLLVCTFKGGR